ncbi:hypothetical protein FVEN_g5712 [Fusarium venenatum]|uniref:Uncharacterized protein n=1 Tax=Fusarium venenatum TaxID=56646 RepID=A0A2L2TC23_9HYPO|nr:uncharacterized protein FVRRES_04140 [Fusarium venenatum]KAG8356394.1 hypothetical protein FVEN_g5712 [Fusarium venenatum]KAH7002906.1 hypothetical protein EDB82DRAFT_531406 [Fusarium venenatum]CEI67628.1 unnamed protein product [Fusarium venenatum]
MAVSGVDSEGVPFGRKLFTERDIHLVSGPKLFRYWRGKGGRAYASGILDDVCHLLKILDEQDGKRQVQFVGCAKSQSEWWDSDKVKETYIELWDEWVQGTTFSAPIPPDERLTNYFQRETLSDRNLTDEAVDRIDDLR